MSLTFYYAPLSTASATAQLLEELEVPHESVLVDLTQGANREPWYLALHPNGKVPAIVHEGVVVFESAAIAMYLGETFGVAKGLYPAPGPTRGEAMKWIVWTNVQLAESVLRWVRHTREEVPAEQRSAAAGRVAREELDANLRILDEALSERPFLTGAYTLADTHLHSFLGWIGVLDVRFDAFPRLGAWMGRCAERPAFQRFLAAMDT